MKVFCMLFRVCVWLGALLLTLLTLAVSAVNMASVTPYWAMIVLGGMGLFLCMALLAGVLTRLVRKAVAWKAVKTLVVIACLFLAQLPLHFCFNTCCSFAVKTYMGRAVPQLEAYHKEKGRYPGTLDEALKDGGPMLKLAGQWASYSVYNERSSYRLTVQRPLAPGQYAFNPALNAWEADH
jgi:hypothetical protein